MMNFDLTPLFRTSIGFDRMAQLLDQANRIDQTPSYPPYNIESIDENNYRITLALAGFGDNDLEITSEQNTLTVKGKKENDVEGKYIHRGIANRSFERRFQLADHVKVKAANMNNGLLHIELEREIPEAMKPRTIAIGTDEKTINQGPKAVENKQDVA
ncbi:Hsp20 family protein [Marinicella sp. S1101]|nr:Hsp20 family protein [Marinicella marina]MCX7554096.1 Hsp20 family protein [Marinicella marina]MDJ1141211.1 Hsp20 family protein [Marinicella marina]